MPPRIPRVQLLAPTRSVERSGGQGTFLAPFSGTQSLGDGVYYINPYEASYGKSNPLEILRQQASKMSDMAGLAENRGYHDAKRRYGMLDSALEDAVLAGMQKNEDMRLLMQVNKSGSPVGAATFQKGDVYGLGTKDRDLMDLDFTGPEPGTLHSLGVLGMESEGRPMIPGLRYIQKAQDILGNDNMFFETINKPDHSNLEYYFNLGARPTGKSSSSGNPYYEFKKRAAREPEGPNPKQLRLEGFRRGGPIKMSGGGILHYLRRAATARDRADVLRDYTRSSEGRQQLQEIFTRPGVSGWRPTIHVSSNENLVLDSAGRTKGHDVSGFYTTPDTPKNRSALADNGWGGDGMFVHKYMINSTEHPTLVPSLSEKYFSVDAVRGLELQQQLLDALQQEGVKGVRRTPASRIWGPSQFDEFITFDPLDPSAILQRKRVGGLVQYKECTCGK